MTTETTLDAEKRLSTTSDPVSDSTPLSRDFNDVETIRLDKRCVRVLDYTVLPLCAIFYFLSFLDRSNIGNARVAGLQVDLGLTSHQYLVAITITYVPYIAAELPSNLLLKAIGPHIMLPGMVVLWGVVCLVQNYEGLLALRFFLGLLEGGLFPGLVLYLSTFYRRHELQVRISLFFSAASLSGAFSGLLAAAIVKMDGVGGLEGWRWIFHLEGLFTVVVGAISFFLLPGTPADSIFLNAEQKAHIIRRLALDNPEGAGADDAPFSWSECLKAIQSPHVLFLAVALFSNGCTLFGLAYFTPSIVATFGYSIVRTQLLTVPPFAVAFVVTMVTAYLSDKYKRRGFGAIATSILAVAGYAVFLASEDSKARYGSLFLTIPGVYGTAPALTTWLPNNSAPHYRKATAIALGFVMTNSGGILSTWLFPSSEAPFYRRGTIVNISFACVTALFAGLNLLYLVRANRLKAEKLKEGLTKEDLVARWHVEGDRHPEYEYTY